MSAWNGVPQNPERDGWHWLASLDGEHCNPVVWHAGKQVWCLTATFIVDANKVAKDCTYLGPCLTPSEVAAAVQAERAAIAAWHQERGAECRDAGDILHATLHYDHAHRIRARGDTSALDAALAAAEARGMERARAAAAECLNAIEGVTPWTPDAMREACKVTITQGGAFDAAIRAQIAAKEDGS